MKITPAAGPAPALPATSNNTEARSKAIAAFNSAGQQQPQQVVQNQNAIAPEEMGAIKAASGQSDNSESSQEDTQEEVIQEQQPEVEEVKEDPAISRQFAQLARQEKALRMKAQQQDQAMRAKEAALAAREAALTNSQPDLSKYVARDRIKQEALAVLAEEGVPYDTLVQQLIDSNSPQDPRMQAHIGRLEAKIQQLEEISKKAESSYKEQQNQAYQAAVNQIKTDVTTLVKNDPNFETIKATKSVNDVVELITQTYDKDGILLSIEEAAQQVEDYLMEEAMNLTKIGKIKKRLQATSQPAAPSPKQIQGVPQAQPQTQMKTLTNATSSSRQLSAKERAILAFKGELKS